jgi:flagellar biosynthetic protein FliP
MATSMTLGMSIWMAIRRHSWRFILEMGAAMYLSFVVLFPTYWAGLLSGDGLLVVGHVVMLPAMAAVILRH